MKSSKWLVLAVMFALACDFAAAKKEKKAAEERASGASEVAAYVGDEAITVGEVDAGAKAELLKVRQQEYDARTRALDAIIQEKLFAREAKARGIAVDALIKAEVDDKAAAPSDAEISDLYERNKARMAGKTLEQAKPEIENVLRQQKLNLRRAELQKELREKAAVRVLLDPPRTPVAVPASWPGAKGPADAPVTVVEFSDYQCPYCKRADPTVSQILQEYGDKIRFVYMDFPLQFHPRAMPSSIAAHCAGEQGKYWPMHENLMREPGDLSDADLAKRAAAVGLDAGAFGACLSSAKPRPQIETAFKVGQESGVTGTPSFFINGRMIVGAKPVDEFKALINDELQRAAAKK